MFTFRSVMGKFWTSNTPLHMNRIVFTSMVVSAAISANIAYLFKDSEFMKLDCAIIKYLRVIMMGNACTFKNGKFKKITNRRVWQHFDLVHCKLEVQVRRLRFVQRWISDKQTHKSMLHCVVSLTLKVDPLMP